MVTDGRVVSTEIETFNCKCSRIYEEIKIMSERQSIMSLGAVRHGEIRRSIN